MSQRAGMSFVESKSPHSLRVSCDRHAILRRLDRSQRFQTRKYCDVTLTVKGKKYPVHKAILGSLSDYFDKLFTTEMIEKYQDCIEISGVAADVLELILSFIYTGKIIINQENVYDIIAAAHYLTIAQLVEICSTFLLKHISLDNCVRTWLSARCSSMEKLESDSGKLIARNYDEVCKKEEFLQLDPINVSDVIQLKNEDATHEESAYRAIISWVKYDLNERRKHFNKLFEMLALEAFTKLYLAQTVTKEDLVRQIPSSFEKAVDTMSMLMIREEQKQDRTWSFLACNKDFTVFRLVDTETKIEEIISRRTEPRHEACVIFMEGYLYLIGGYIQSNKEPTTGVQRLNIGRPEIGWENFKSLNHARRNATVFLCDNHICVEGGIGVTGCVFHLKEEYIPERNAWVLDPPTANNALSLALRSRRPRKRYRVRKEHTLTRSFGLSAAQPITGVRAFIAQIPTTCGCVVCDVTVSCGNKSYKFKQGSVVQVTFAKTSQNYLIVTAALLQRDLSPGVQLGSKWTITADAASERTEILSGCDAWNMHHLQLDDGVRVVDACPVQHKIIATVHSHDLMGVDHYLGEYDTELNTGRVLQNIADIQDYHKLVSLENPSSTSSRGKGQ